MGKLSRRKGVKWELVVVRMLTAIPGVTAERILDECRRGNAGDVETNLPLCIQAKIGAAPPIWRAVREAEAAATEGRWAVAFVKRNQGPGRPPQEIVAMPVDHWLEIAATLKREKIW